MTTDKPPIPTDFSTWARPNLERFAREAADENLQLRDDLKTALAGWRKAATENQKETTQ